MFYTVPCLTARESPPSVKATEGLHGNAIGSSGCRPLFVTQREIARSDYGLFDELGFDFSRREEPARICRGSNGQVEPSERCGGVMASLRFVAHNVQPFFPVPAAPRRRSHFDAGARSAGTKGSLRPITEGVNENTNSLAFS
ncbi:MAG: hypothetical protein INR68_13650 [Methylobacterium mesophilicum]|nr:hypothetical protein [Methylobacterium mesophilicum]